MEGWSLDPDEWSQWYRVLSSFQEGLWPVPQWPLKRFAGYHPTMNWSRGGRHKLRSWYTKAFKHLEGTHSAASREATHPPGQRGERVSQASVRFCHLKLLYMASFFFVLATFLTLLLTCITPKTNGKPHGSYPE